MLFVDVIILLDEVRVGKNAKLELWSQTIECRGFWLKVGTKKSISSAYSVNGGVEMSERYRRDISLGMWVLLLKGWGVR